MIIIPELKTVILQPPRTGTSSVKDAVLKRYPQSFLLYRHMEYSGIPTGYEQFRIVCQVRNPFDRMESLFRYMSNPELRGDTDPVWLENVTADTRDGFKNWLLNGTYIFANGQPSEAKDYRPKYQVNFPQVEQRKSQRHWAQYADRLVGIRELNQFAERSLDLVLPRRGVTKDVPIYWDEECIAHMKHWHAWDINHFGGITDNPSVY